VGHDTFFPDVRIASAASLNAEMLGVGGGVSGGASAIRFDLAGLPQDISHAAIQLYLSGTASGQPPGTMLLGTPTHSWSEGSSISTLVHYEHQTWLPAPTGPGWYSIDVTSLYNQWQSGAIDNNGIVLLPVGMSVTQNQFYSSDYAGDPTLRPRLVVYERQPEEILGTSDHDPLFGTERADHISGLAGNDVLSGAGGNDVLDGGADPDLINGGDGIDTVTYIDSPTGVSINLADNDNKAGWAEGDSIINVERVIGSRFDDVIAGSGVDDKLYGEAGDDTIVGGSGEGDDTYDGGEGVDTVVYSSATQGVVVNLAAASNHATGAEIGTDQIAEIENVVGGGGSDTITGDDAANSLSGGAGNDKLNAGGGDDLVEGGDGRDVMTGGANGAAGDTVSYASATAGVTINLASTGSQNTGGGNTDRLSGFENLTGSEFDDSLTGTDFANTLIGLAGNDTLNGDYGTDMLIGGTGDDIYIANLGDIVDESDGDGIDTVRSSGAFDLSNAARVKGDVERLTLIGTSAVAATGNALANVITGNSGNNALAGLGGADALIGGAGSADVATYVASGEGVNVSLMTGLGSGGDAEGDTLAEIEWVTGSSFDDTIEGNSGANTFVGGGGLDTLSYANAAAGVTVSLAKTGAQDTVGAGLDKLSGFEHIAGSAFADSLTGNSGSNILTGGGGSDSLFGGGGADSLFGGDGADTMVGGAGDDLYAVDNAGDIVDETGGGGIDTIESSITFSLSDAAHAKGAIENLTITGTSALAATGNALDNILTGNSGNNALAGLGGADQLFGGAGSTDTATYAASGAGVNVSLMTGLGSGGDAEGDRLAGIERLVGSAFDDTLEGDSGDNRFAGGANGSGGDTISYANAIAAVKVTLASTIEQNTGGAGLDLLTGFENLTGSAFNDTLTGTGGANVLTGLGGNDIMKGGAGADTFVFRDGDGTDTVSTFDDGFDLFDLTAVSGVHSFADLALTDTGPGVLVDYGTGSFHLATVSNPTVIGGSDFLFA
jgi:Ca2+-binding RTX toxin-like protein